MLLSTEFWWHMRQRCHILSALIGYRGDADRSVGGLGGVHGGCGGRRATELLAECLQSVYTACFACRVCFLLHTTAGMPRADMGATKPAQCYNTSKCASNQHCWLAIVVSVTYMFVTAASRAQSRSTKDTQISKTAPIISYCSQDASIKEIEILQKQCNAMIAHLKGLQCRVAC